MKSKDILGVFEQIRKSAKTGLNYAKNPYDKTRYEEIVRLSEQIGELISNVEIEQIDPVDKTGYITPKIGVNGIIENSEGKLLLEKRSDDLSWGIPGGWAEVGLTAEENLRKEIAEETGYEVKVERLVDVMSRKPSYEYPFTSYHLLFKCSIISGELKKSHESEIVEWKEVNRINNWHFDHYEWIKYYYSLK